QENLAGIEQQKSEPTQIAFTAFNRQINPFPKGDPRYVSTPDEDIAELNAATLDQAKQFYHDFYGASNAQLTVIGDFDEQEITRLTTELFSDWKSPRPFKRVPSVFRDIAPANQTFQAPDKANAFFVAGFLFDMRDDNADYAAIALGHYMLGGGFLSSRLAARIRQKEGLSYGVGSGILVSAIDHYGREEIARMLKDGFTAEEVEAAKSGYLQSRQVSRAQDNELLNRSNTYLFVGRTWQWDADFEAKIKALTPEQINAAMRKYVDPSKLVIYKAGDFAKNPPK
ncbi:MAG: insulinase family protein, partial [Acidobacteria bacterium]